MVAICSGEIARTQGAGVRRGEDALKVLNLGDGSVNFHDTQLEARATSILEFAAVREVPYFGKMPRRVTR
jgi:hypothetical protein